MEFTSSNQGVLGPSWFSLIRPIMKEGYRLKIGPKGRSMIPFLRGDRDEVILTLPENVKDIRVGDIILYQEDGVYVLHRICRIRRGREIYTAGDGHSYLEGPFYRKDILAVVDDILRKGKKIQRSDKAYLFWVSVWRMLRKVRYPLLVAGYSPIVSKIYIKFFENR